MKNILILIGVVVALGTQAQFLDAFTLFKPQVSFKGNYCFPATNGTSNTVYEGSVAVFAPVSSSFKVDMDWKSLLKSRKLSDLKNVPSVDARQVFARFKLGYRGINNDIGYINGLHEIGVGAFGLTWLRLRSKPKLKLTVTHLNVAFAEDINFTSALPNVTFIYGKLRIFNLKTFGFFGVAAGNSNFLPYATPILAVSTYLTPKIQAMVVLPVQAKITLKAASWYKVSLVGGLGGYSNGISVQKDTLSALKRNYYSLFQMKASIQNSFKLGSKAKLYLEAGYAGMNRLRIRPVSDYVYALNPGPFVQLSFNYSFAKGIFNSETFELDL